MPKLLRYARYVLIAGLALSGLTTALMFPYWVDPPADQTVRSREYYAKAYTKAVAGDAAAAVLS